ncbi:hypothetical protein HN873_054266 [Arachis hypogaea]
MAKTQINDLTGPAKYATCHVSIKRIEIPYLSIERGKSPSPALPPQSASFVLPFRQEDSSPTKLPWWTPCKFNTIPMVFYFSVARQPCDHPTTVNAVRTILHCHRWTSVPVSLELKDTVVRAYRTDPVQVRSCPFISLFDYINALVLLRTSDVRLTSHPLLTSSGL